MKTRTVSKVIPARIYNMGDMKVRQPLPSNELNYFDPFILLHHAHNIVEEHIPLQFAGVGPHPHRGFSPVTFVFKGGSHHRDSRGNDNKVYAGGTQWMNAGMGIMHSERPLERELELIQMWVNTPAKHKGDQPQYFPLDAADTPSFWSDDEKVKVNIIAGEFQAIKGKIPTFTPINAFTIEGNIGGNITIELPTPHNTFLYLLDGQVNVDGKDITGKNFIAFKNDGDAVNIQFLENTRCLLMSGEPIGEPIVAQGPFVMNSEHEILVAYRDYQMGKMGILIEE